MLPRRPTRRPSQTASPRRLRRRCSEELHRRGGSTVAGAVARAASERAGGRPLARAAFSQADGRQPIRSGLIAYYPSERGQATPNRKSCTLQCPDTALALRCPRPLSASQGACPSSARPCIGLTDVVVWDDRVSDRSCLLCARPTAGRRGLESVRQH